MNKKASVMIELLVFLIIAVFLSASILFLIKSGIIHTKDSYEDVNLLNTEFLPLGRGGSLLIKDLSFCSYVNQDFHCFEKDDFYTGETVYVRFVVESSVTSGEVLLNRKYVLKNPQGETVIIVEESSSYQINTGTGFLHRCP